MTTPLIDENSACPDECGGVLHYPKVDNCSCHINPPCSACTDITLTCDNCGWEQEYLAPIDSSKSYALPEYKPFTGYEYQIAEGKRLHSVFYDGSSGSTMVFKGKIEGDVSAQEIFEKLGDGTFGHRGPSIFGNTFTYTKITD